MSKAHEKEIETLRTVFWSERDPEGRAFAPLADAYRRVGDFRQAAELLREGLARLPEFATGHLVAARLYLERGLAEEAELASRRVLALDDENVMAWGLLIGALEARGASGEAAGARSRLGLLDPASIQKSGEAVSNVVALAPDEEPVWDIGALAPDEEPVWDIATLAPDEEPAWDIAALAPDEEPAWDIAALAPDEEPVWDIAALAPDEEPVWDIAALAPDEEPVLVTAAPLPDEELVVEMAWLAPDEPAMDVADAAPDAVATAPVEERVAEMPAVVLDQPVTLGADEPLMTRTMAELYVRQGLFDRALDIYRILRASNPADAEFSSRIADLETRRGDPPDAAPASPAPVDSDEDDLADHAWHAGIHVGGDDVDTPFAWTEVESERAPAGPPIGNYFRRLLSWEPGGTQTEEAADPEAPTRRDDPSRWFHEGEA